MESTTSKGILVLLAVTIIGGVVVAVIVKKSDATPELKFIKAEPFPRYTDLIVQSNSSQPFIIHGYDLLIQQVLHDPPARETHQPVPSPPFPVRPNRRFFYWRRMAPEESPQTCGAPLPVDDIRLSIPPQPRLGAWLPGDRETRQAKAYEPERIRLWVIDKERAGAQYLVSVRVIYGNAENPKEMVIQNVPLNVIDGE